MAVHMAPITLSVLCILEHWIYMYCKLVRVKWVSKLVADDPRSNASVRPDLDVSLHQNSHPISQPK